MARFLGLYLAVLAVTSSSVLQILAKTGTIQDVDHGEPASVSSFGHLINLHSVVLFMQENRAFDHVCVLVAVAWTGVLKLHANSISERWLVFVDSQTLMSTLHQTASRCGSSKCKIRSYQRRLVMFLKNRGRRPIQQNISAFAVLHKCCGR